MKDKKEIQSVTVRLDKLLFEKLKDLAKKDGRSFNNFVERQLAKV